MSPINIALTLWQMGLVSVDRLVAWADAQILDQANPASELFELSLHGPTACLKLPEYEFPPRPLELTFTEEFALRAEALDTNSCASASEFVKWASRRCMGENLEEPEVALGYQLDHLSCDCNDMSAALRLLQEELPRLMPRCRATARVLLAQVPDLSIERATGHGGPVEAED